MVILAGLAASDQGKQAALNVLYHVENATPYMEYYVLLALFSAGEPQQAMERMLRRYQPLIDNENSTLWEDFKILGTKNHAWSGGPLTLLYQYAAGITPLKPGFEVVSIRPLVTGLNNINASMESVKGQISVQISFDSERYFIKVMLPSAVSGKLSVPKGAFSDGIGDVIIDGQIVHGVDDGTHITFNVPGGDHELLAVSRGQRQIKSRQFEKHCIAFAK